MDFEGSRDVLHRLALRKELACQFPLIELSRSSKLNTAFSGSLPPGAGSSQIRSLSNSAMPGEDCHDSFPRESSYSPTARRATQTLPPPR
jgi:hypothetical protein